MQQNWYRTSWCHKIGALIIICTYFILLIFIHDTTYIWATLALIFVLFVTAFSCASNNSPFLLQLRGSRLTGITNRAIAQERNEEEQEQNETRIWMTDIPPSYSFVMADITDITPPTPPPSYGSAILMFPPPYMDIDTKSEPTLAAEATLVEGQQRRPLSISTQVSVSSPSTEATHLGGITFSTQVSVISTQSEIPPDLAVRARFYISRQASREDGTEDSALQQEKMIGEASARLFLLSRQISREEHSEELENIIQHSGKVDRLVPPLVTRQFSKEESSEGFDHHKSMKHDLRRRVLLSRQASREERVTKVIQEQDQFENSGRPLSRQSSVEDITENGVKKSDGRVRIIILQQNSKETANKENQNIENTINQNTDEAEACSSSSSVNIPEKLEEL